MGEAGVRVQKEANDSDEWDKQAYLHSECSLNAPGPTETTGEGVGSVCRICFSSTSGQR